MSIISCTKNIADVTDEDQNACWQVLKTQFIGVTKEGFLKDFLEKDVVMLLISTEEDRIVGFSTLMVIDLSTVDQKIKGIFSGDTAVYEKYRKSQGLGIELSNFFTKALEEYPDYLLYYILISKGYRTYRLLPFFFKEFFPRHDALADDQVLSVIKRFSQAKYTNNIYPKSGLLKFSGEVQRLSPDCLDAQIPEKQDCHTAFFFKKNPSYLQGNELVCVARVSKDNFAIGMQRMIRYAERKKAVL